MDGFAIPHAKSEAIVEATILVVRHTQPLAWESLDGEAIKYILAYEKMEYDTTKVGRMSDMLADW